MERESEETDAGRADDFGGELPIHQKIGGMERESEETNVGRADDVGGELPEHQKKGEMEYECECVIYVDRADDFGGELVKPQKTGGTRHDRGKPYVDPETRVAFFAGRWRDFGPENRDSDLDFDRVVTNVGLAFDKHSGRFKAPVRATYQFSVTFTGQYGSKAAAVSVLKNGVKVLTVGSETNATWGMSTSVPILTLNADDEVWVQVLKDTHVFGDMKTSFSGFLLFRN